MFMYRVRGFIFMAAGNGVYVSIDGARNWKQANQGLPNWAVPYALGEDDLGNMLVGLRGYGLYQGAIKLGVNETIVPEIDVRVSPNPVVSEVHFEFPVYSAASVVLTITDVNGRTVHAYEREVFKEGMHRLYWETDDVPDGVYIYQIRSKNGIASGTVVVHR